MKTKYILHGGNAQLIIPENDPFYSEILKDTEDNLKVLFVYFGDDPEKEEIHLAGNIAQFDRVKGNKNIEYEMAKLNDFLTQIKKSDIVYIRGGKTGKLMDSLSKFTNLNKYFSGKVVSGESAGMNVLATYCYSKSGGVMKGLGIIQVKTIPHFDGKTGVEELENVAPELEKCYFPDFRFKVFFR